jgi:hypothetical protein
MIDIIFVADIIMMFFTSFLDMKTGQECKDFNLISKNFRGTQRFYTDLLSIFGSKPF